MEKKDRERFSVYLTMEEVKAYMDDNENHLEGNTGDVGERDELPELGSCVHERGWL